MTAGKYRVSFGEWCKCSKIIAKVTQFCEYTEKNWAVYFKWVDFIICEWYLNKTF